MPLGLPPTMATLPLSCAFSLGCSRVALALLCCSTSPSTPSFACLRKLSIMVKKASCELAPMTSLLRCPGSRTWLCFSQYMRLPSTALDYPLSSKNAASSLVQILIRRHSPKCASGFASTLLAGKISESKEPRSSLAFLLVLWPTNFCG